MGAPFSDVDTASSEEARSHSLLQTQHHYAQIKQDFEGVKVPASVCDSVIVFPALPNCLPQGLFVLRAALFSKKVDTKLALTGSPFGKKEKAPLT